MTEYGAPVEDKDVAEYSGFLGLRNNVTAESFGREDLVTALNVDIDDSLGVGRRKGFSAPVTAAVDRSLFANGETCLGVGSNALKLVKADWTTTTLRSGLTPLLPLSYAALADRIYYSNGAESGCVQNGANRTWGIAPPGGFTVSAGSGTLRAGKYQVTLTYLRNDGQESGAARAATIEIASTGGLVLSAILPSVDPTVTHTVIYATPVGGETFCRAGMIANSATTYTIADDAQFSAAVLATQFLQPPPAGEYVASWKGWMLVASGNRLYPSEPYAPELFDWRKSVPFSSRITMLAALNNQANGVWVGTGSQVVWLDGDSPETWKPVVKAEYGVIPGTLAFADGELLGDGSAAGDVVAFFAATRGLCTGRNGGAFANLTQARYAYSSQPRGAAVVRRHRGSVQMVCTLQGAETPGNIAA